MFSCSILFIQCDIVISLSVMGDRFFMIVLLYFSFVFNINMLHLLKVWVPMFNPHQLPLSNCI